MSGVSSSKNLTLMGNMAFSYGNYTSLSKEKGVDSLFPLWTSAVGLGLEVGIKWKSLIAKLEYNGCSRGILANDIGRVEDSLQYITDFGIIRSHMILPLRIPKIKICVEPMIGYAYAWEWIVLKTLDGRTLRQQWYSEGGLSYGGNAEIKLFDSPWRPLAFLSGCCFGGRPILEEKEETEKVSDGEDKIPIYLNIGYFSIVSNQTKFMEKFSIRIIAEEFPLDLRGLSSLNFLIGTSLYLKNGKFKWWEKMFVGLGLTGDF